MGGGDLNMKKSWHPLLHVNQERVWKQEKKAYEERKKLDELKRERDREREMQELQRLQEEAGGKKRADRVDWMYATPASGSGPSASELEDYLLGKKRVDQFLQKKAKEADAAATSSGVGAGGSGSGTGTSAGKDSFMALQNANTAGDLAAKIREDPMFAIKQQEQAAYQALLKDPTRLRQMRAAAGLDVEDKEEKRRRKEEKRRRKEEKRRGSSSTHDHYQRDGRRRSEYPSPDCSRRYGTDGEYGSRSSSHRDDRRDGYDRHRTSDRDFDRRERYRYDDRDGSRRTEAGGRAHDGDEDEDRYNRRPRHHSRSPRRSDYSPQRRDDGYSRRDRPRDGDRDRQRDAEYHRSRPPPRVRSPSPERSRPPPRDTRPPQEPERRQADSAAAADRAAKLERMQAQAAKMNAEREAYLGKVRAEEEEEARREEAARQRMEKRGEGAGKGSFMLDQQRKVFGGEMDLSERLSRVRGGGGLQRVGD